jgi:hypothetical protein
VAALLGWWQVHLLLRLLLLLLAWLMKQLSASGVCTDPML